MTGANTHTKHKAIDESFSQRIEDLLYSKTDEKAIAAGILKKILAGRRFSHALDIGAGPGDLTGPIADASDRLTIVEILPEYAKTLKEKFPKAEVLTCSIDDLALKHEYDLIMLSQVLYYFPKDEWAGLVQKLSSALVTEGRLIIIQLCDFGDWWETVSRYWKSLRKYIRFDYIPLSEFKTSLSQSHVLKSYPFRSKVRFESLDVMVDCMGLEVLQINDKRVLRENRDDFIRFAEHLTEKNGGMVFNYECEMIELEKRKKKKT